MLALSQLVPVFIGLNLESFSVLLETMDLLLVDLVLKHLSGVVDLLHRGGGNDGKGSELEHRKKYLLIINSKSKKDLKKTFLNSKISIY